jgi:hypothetical protein
LTPSTSLTNFGTNNIEEVKQEFSSRIEHLDCEALNRIRDYTNKWKSFEFISIETDDDKKEMTIISSFYERELRESENELRIKKGIPKIGEGWISETELYYKVKNEFPQYNVCHHGRPEWIGRQHLDIYIEELNIAIEYMGSQHYEPIDYFGGELSLIKTIERDKIKRIKCKDNSCVLLIVKENYKLSEIINTIKSISLNRNREITLIEFPL